MSRIITLNHFVEELYNEKVEVVGRWAQLSDAYRFGARSKLSVQGQKYYITCEMYLGPNTLDH
jgi:hypothetical protein